MKRTKVNNQSNYFHRVVFSHHKSNRKEWQKYNEQQREDEKSLKTNSEPMTYFSRSITTADNKRLIVVLTFLRFYGIFSSHTQLLRAYALKRIFCSKKK